LLITMRAFNERAASKSGRAHVIFDQDLAAATINKNVAHKADGKTGRSRLHIRHWTPAKLNGDYYINIYLSNDDLIRLIVEAFGSASLVKATHLRAKRKQSN
jgi:hypothetical protein